MLACSSDAKSMVLGSLEQGFAARLSCYEAGIYIKVFIHILRILTREVTGEMERQNHMRKLVSAELVMKIETHVILRLKVASKITILSSLTNLTQVSVLFDPSKDSSIFVMLTSQTHCSYCCAC